MPEDPSSFYLKLSEAIIQDYRSLISETRRKFAPIKDVSINSAFVNNNKLLLEPFLNGCLTKQQKIVIISLTAIQRFITNSCLSEEGAGAVVGILWNLMCSNIEEVRVLQTTILLLTASSLVRNSLLAKAFTLCLRLHASKTPATVNTAAAAVRQCASAVFDRVVKDEESKENTTLRSEDVTPVNVANLSPVSRDAYRLFLDICALLGDEPLTWLTGITEFSRALGLELIESLVLHYPGLFRQSVAFAYLLKTNLCPLVIKLFSPSLKLRSTPTGASPVGVDPSGSVVSSTVAVSHTASCSTNNTVSVSEKVSFPILVRLKRLITVIVEQYFHLLNTECEIYLSLLIRFLDVDKVAWERALALEVLYKFAMQPKLICYVCMSYDMRPHSTKIFHEWINTLSHYVQLVLASPSVGDELSKESVPVSSTGHQPGPNQSLLYYKGVFFPIVQPKSLLLDLLDRGEPPVLVDGYCLSVAIACITRIVESLRIAVHDAKECCPSDADARTNVERKTAEVDEQLVALSWCGCLSALALLLETSADEKITTDVLQAMHTMIGLTGSLGADVALDAFVTNMCKASLPSSYARLLFSVPSKASPLNNPSTSVVHEEAFERSPVVIVVTQGAGHTINITPTNSLGTGVPVHVSSGASSTTGSSHAPSTGSTQGHDSIQNFPVGSLLITAKHLQAAKAVLHCAQTHGNVLGRSWNVILTTLQNLVWMLGLKIEPDAELFFKPTPVSIALARDGDMPSAIPGSAGSVVSPAGISAIATPIQPRRPVSSSLPTVSTDLAALSSMLSTLFTQSNQLTVSALNDLVLGLTQLSSEAMEAVSLNKDPSPFPITKLTELGLVNINRLQLWWDSVCCQLLSVSVSFSKLA
ncbi:hypothetical protein FBUS_00236 [Fasciolopsis buskii]|uniref:Protein MON2 homolog n=1 Tax=Fasciolopsis buskii TaxID=27845 RepID=A0A8E0VLW9_9TREM|nr:hypothetical protein FBUS_00236 [Fasciolopsis buski]